MLHPIKRKKGETEEARGVRRLIIKLKDEGKTEKAGSTITAVIHPKSSCSEALPV